MYDYDFFPQEVCTFNTTRIETVTHDIQDNLPFPMGIVVQHLHKHVQTCDGVLAASTSAFEKEAISSGRKWLESVGLDTYVVGPLEDAPARDVASNSNYYSEEDAKIFEFLNSMQQKHGNKTVIYVRTLVKPYIQFSCSHCRPRWLSVQCFIQRIQASCTHSWTR